jgi:LPXTG-motif cell wall-anchored protein
MKKFAVLLTAVMAAAFVLLGPMPSASAYPELTCDLTVDHQVISSGDSFTATGTAAGFDANNQPVSGSDTHWTYRWNGVTKHRTGLVTSATFTAPQVSQTRKITLTGRTTSPAGSCQRSIVITVLAASVAGPTEDLPNTGGPAFMLLVGGLALLLVGGGAVALSRRNRQTHLH